MALSDGDDFFKKGATSYPCGRDAATGKESGSKWASVEKRMAAKALLFVAACGCAGIAGLAGGVDQHQKLEAEKYDISLYSTIDSIAETGVPMDAAIEKGFMITNHNLDKSSKSLDAHIDKRLSEAREIVDVELNDHGTYDITYAYKPEFYDHISNYAHLAKRMQEARRRASGRNEDGSFMNSAAGRAAIFQLTRGF